MAAALLPLLVLAVAVLVFLRLRVRGRSSHRNHCPYPNPVLGDLVPLVRNFHRFLDWATDLLAAAPASTIEVRGVLGLAKGVATADPGVVDHFLRAGFPNYVKGARFAGPFADLLGSGLFLADGRLWSLQRKLATYAFSSRSLRSFSGRVLQAHLRRGLLPFLAAAAGSGEAVDLQDVLKRFAFDNICSVAFGVESSTLLELEAGGRGHEAFFRAFDDAVEISFRRVFHPSTVVWKAMRLAGVGSERRLRDAIRVIDEHVTAIMESEERSRGDGDEQHLLSRFAAAMEEDEGSELGAMFRSPEAKRRFLVLLAPRRQPALRAARVRGGGVVAPRRRRQLRRAQGDALPARGDAAVPAGAHQLAGGGGGGRAAGRHDGARRLVLGLLRVRDGEDGAAVGRRLPRVPPRAVARRGRRVRGGGRGEVPGLPRRPAGVPREGDGVRADEGRCGRRGQEVRRRAGAGGEHGGASAVRDGGDVEDEGRPTCADKEARERRVPVGTDHAHDSNANRQRHSSGSFSWAISVKDSRAQTRNTWSVKKI